MGQDQIRHHESEQHHHIDHNRVIVHETARAYYEGSTNARHRSKRERSASSMRLTRGHFAGVLIVRAGDRDALKITRIFATDANARRMLGDALSGLQVG